MLRVVELAQATHGIYMCHAIAQELRSAIRIAQAEVKTEPATEQELQQHGLINVPWLPPTIDLFHTCVWCALHI